MSFDWKSFSDVGYHLYEYSKEENYLRSSVGRFYYAAFGLAKEYYENTHHTVIPSFNAHDALIDFLSDSVYSEENELSEFLFQLRRFRVGADYHKIFNKDFANLSKEKYSSLEKLIDELNENPVVPKF